MMNRRRPTLAGCLGAVIAACLCGLAALGLLAWHFGQGISVDPGGVNPFDLWWPHPHPSLAHP